MSRDEDLDDLVNSEDWNERGVVVSNLTEAVRLCREARDERDEALKQKGYSDESAHIYASDLDKSWAENARLVAVAEALRVRAESAERALYQILECNVPKPYSSNMADYPDWWRIAHAAWVQAGGPTHGDPEPPAPNSQRSSKA